MWGLTILLAVGLGSVEKAQKGQYVLAVSLGSGIRVSVRRVRDTSWSRARRSP